MPGYTHLQHAQPITYGWYLLGVEAALARDSGRIEDALLRMDECPLGAGALAGTRFPIDRKRTAGLLDFARPQPHSLDAVASRDALVELLAAATQVAVTVGRMSQDLYLWATYEFGMLEFPDRVASTSSMMPQKKNLTVLENLKARPAALIGALTTAIVALRGMPFGHSQEVSIETGRWAADAIDELIAILPAARIVVECATPRVARMEHLAGANFATATTLADLLVARRGLPFREAHHITGHYVRLVMNGTDAETAIREAFASETGRELDDAGALLTDALSPAGVLDATTGCGPSRAESTVLLSDARRRLTDAEIAAADRQNRRDCASYLLAVACKELETTASHGARR
jgi:argininosuccinate lyase